MGCRVSICRVLCTPTHSGPDHTHTHTCSPWCAYTLQLGTTALRHTSRCTHPQTTAELHRHTPSHTDVHISGYTLTYMHTYPCTSSYKLTCHTPELHTHSSPHALCLGMLTHTTKYTPNQACTCSTQVWTHKQMQALFLLHSPTQNTDIHPYKSTSTYPHKHTDTHPHACRQHTDGRTDGQTDTHRSQREPGAARRALAARGSAPHFIDLATGRAEAASFA